VAARKPAAQARAERLRAGVGVSGGLARKSGLAGRRRSGECAGGGPARVACGAGVRARLRAAGSAGAGLGQARASWWRGVETHGSEPAQAVAARGVERSGSGGEGQ
jgi:hypothetical protein